MKGGGEMVLTHLGSSSPMSNHGCLLSFTGSCLVSSHLFSLLAICFHWWAFVHIGCSFSLVGICFHWWAFICTGGGSSSFIVVGWPSSLLVWCGGNPLVAGSCAVGFVGSCS